MEFLQIILQNSNIKEAKLYGAAQKAAANPEIGITIQNKAAYHVIKDCANITMSYLPHLVFGSYQNPFESLKSKFKRDSIIEFVKQAETNVSLNQLLHIIITKAEKMNLLSSPSSVAITRTFDAAEHSGDPYGDYGHEQAPLKQPASGTGSSADILCKIFNVE